MKLINRIFGRFAFYRKFVGGRWVRYPRRWLPGKFWYRVCRRCNDVSDGFEIKQGDEESFPYPLDNFDL